MSQRGVKRGTCNDQNSPTGETVDAAPSAAVVVTVPSAGKGNKALVQLHLLLLLHAYNCIRKERLTSAQKRPCSFPKCSVLRQTLCHMPSCNGKKDCVVPHCVTSTQIISHWTKCTDTDCFVCAPLKQIASRSSWPQIFEKLQRLLTKFPIFADKKHTCTALKQNNSSVPISNPNRENLEEKVISSNFSVVNSRNSVGNVPKPKVADNRCTCAVLKQNNSLVAISNPNRDNLKEKIISAKFSVVNPQNSVRNVPRPIFPDDQRTRPPLRQTNGLLARSNRNRDNLKRRIISASFFVLNPQSLVRNVPKAIFAAIRQNSLVSISNPNGDHLKERKNSANFSAVNPRNSVQNVPKTIPKKVGGKNLHPSVLRKIRKQAIYKILQIAFPNVLRLTSRDSRLLNFILLVKKLECEMYRIAGSLEEYHRLVMVKACKMREKIVDARQEKKIQTQNQEMG